MNIVAFGASHSKKSINKSFASYVAGRFVGHNIEILDLNDFDLPLYTVDLESAIGFPKQVHRFLQKIASADLLIISMAEHNGNHTAGFKNLFDWSSRVNDKLFLGKKLFLLSTSPGKRGAIASLNIALTRFPYHGAEIVATFSLPSYYENFSEDLGIVNQQLDEELMAVISGLNL